MLFTHILCDFNIVWSLFEMQFLILIEFTAFVQLLSLTKFKSEHLMSYNFSLCMKDRVRCIEI